MSVDILQNLNQRAVQAPKNVHTTLTFHFNSFIIPGVVIYILNEYIPKSMLFGRFQIAVMYDLVVVRFQAMSAIRTTSIFPWSDCPRF